MDLKVESTTKCVTSDEYFASMFTWTWDHKSSLTWLLPERKRWRQRARERGMHVQKRRKD